MIKNNLIFYFLALVVTVSLSSCGDDDDVDTTKSLTINIEKLEDLGSDYVYEGWVIVDGAPVSTGTFTVDANGALSQSSFDVRGEDLDAATTFVLSIEPTNDPDPAPSAVKILAGEFSGNSSTLSINHAAALNTDFASAAGKYILATPTNGMDNDELSGVWFLDPALGPGAGLELPELGDGWQYEGWAVIDGTPVSTGTFETASGADAGATYSGTEPGPAYPGEDFLVNAPDGLTFPVDLSGAPIVISVEPVPDNSPAPFSLKPLFGTAGTADHTVYELDNNAANTNPTGTVNR